jgi:hypothetical protein
MSLFASNFEKARKALEQATSRHDLLLADQEAHRLTPAHPGDFEANKEWTSRGEEFSRDITIAHGVVEHWRGVVAKLEDEAAEKDLDAAHGAEQKRVVADEKLLREFERLTVALQVNLEQQVASAARTAAVNASRGARPFIDDFEARVRREPPQVSPAVRETVTAWFDPDGTRHGTNQRYDERLCRWVLAPERVQREVVDTLREEDVYAGVMPSRLAELVRLFDLTGRQIWPR